MNTPGAKSARTSSPPPYAEEAVRNRLATSDNCTVSLQYTVGCDAINPINEQLYYAGDYPPQIQPMEEVLSL